MNLEVLPDLFSTRQANFAAKHPMFKYEIDALEAKFFQKLRRAKAIVVVGLGGSALPLKAFVDFFQLNDRVHFLDTVDPDRFKKLSKIKGSVFCVVSKSGETLEIKALLAELIASKRLKDLVIVTDRVQGMLRNFATEHEILTLPIPAEIGGRFTHFSVFHRAVLEACGIKFLPLLKMARTYAQKLRGEPSILNQLFRQLFEEQKTILVLWAYGDRLLGLCQWIQQVIAESLGKKIDDSRRLGITPLVLQGPQDQHSVLQLLVDGPQDKVLWFFESAFRNRTSKRNLKAPLEDFNRLGLSESLNILCESTFQTFKERLGRPETAEPLGRFKIRSTEDFIHIIVGMQALVEFSADQLKINAFDQPGVERGKEIARLLVKAQNSKSSSA